MSNNQFNLRYEAELNEGIRVTTLSPIFCSGDIEAHSFIVKVMRKGKPVNLAGTTVRGFFIRPDNVTITLEGSVNADGEAVVTLSDACYNKQGRFQLVIRVTMGGVISTVFCGLGGMLLTVTDGFIDEDNVIPSLGDLLAQIDAHRPDFIEVLPGIIPGVIREITEKTTVPLIAGGLIRSKQDVIQALQAGVVAVSTTCRDVWQM